LVDGVEEVFGGSEEPDDRRAGAESLKIFGKEFFQSSSPSPRRNTAAEAMDTFLSRLR
jgi:hypothetical protein